MKALFFFAVVICMALGLGRASATTYYVELGGNDANSGLAGAPWRTLTKACAEVPADQGHSIQVGEGTFTEAGILTLKSGVSLIGAGSTKTTIRVNHYFSLTDAVPNANPHVDTFPEQFVIQMNGQNQTVKGFALDGQTKTCHGGIFAALARNVIFEDLNVTNFRYCGLWMHVAHNTTLRFSSFKNNTYGNPNRGDSGAVQYHTCTNLAIHDNRVEETGNLQPNVGGYALKAQDRSFSSTSANVLERMRIYNNTLIAPTQGAWENGLAPAMTAEFLGVGMRECEIYNNTLNNTLSMAGGSRGTRNRIHHNFFNLGWGRYAYAIEASMSDLEIDHNHFFGGLYPIALWGGNPQNHNIHHNLFEGACAGGFVNQALLNYTSPITNLRFLNNTIIDNGGIGGIFALHPSSTYEARNNLIIHTAGQADIWGTNLAGTVSDNFFSNVTPRGTNAMTGDPGISLSLVNGTPLSSPYYTIQPGSPLLNAGQSISPWAADFTGTAPDIGAIESGVSFAGTDYFVDPAGNDSNTGTSEASAWKSLAKVNATNFQPGDRIRFKKGGTWYGSLWPKGSGDSTAQITLGSYGTGAKPLIDAQGAETAVIKLSDQEYWTIDGFEVTNWATTKGMRFGIRVEAGDGQVKHRIRILNNTVRDIYGIMGMPEPDNTTGYWVGGIYFQIYEPGKADDVLIEGNDVRNIIGEAISFWGEGENSGGGMNYTNCSPNVVVRGNTVWNTSGDGILLYGTANELVEYNHVGYVSELQTQSVNTAAAWPTRHIGGLWQYNHVHHTRRKGNDGTAFDNDGYTSGTTIFQHNVSHDNEGGFIMEYTWNNGDVSAKTIARYNISWNDSRIVASNRGGMELYNNVFYSPNATLGVEWTGTGTRVNFRNNLFVAAGRSTEFGSQAFFNNTFSGGITKPTSANNTNKERDPLFVNPTTTGDLAGFILQTGSSERAAGQIISGNGGIDFWRTTLPGTAPHRGASQISAITDYTATPTFLTASGPFTATIPLSGTSTLAFTAELRDQNFHLISPTALTWSLSPAASGYSIDTNGVVTISSTAQPQRIAVIATNGSLTGSASFGTVEQTTGWNNGAGTGKWNTTDANWSDSTWTDGSNAVFSHTAAPETVTLEGARSAQAMRVGNGGNNANYTFTSAPGGSLSTASFMLQGAGSNDVNSTPLTIFDNAAITVAGNLGIGRARLSISGSSVIQAATIGGGGIAASADWGYLTLSGNANVTASNGIIGNTTAWGINLNGGTLTTTTINASDYNSLGAYLHFNGTTVRASASNPAFVTLFNGSKAYIGAGGANIDTNGHDIGIGVTLADASSASPASNGGTTLSGTGFLNKIGPGTLILTGANSYGATTIANGTLQIGDNTTTGTLGGGAVTNNAALVFNRSNDFTVGNLISGSGSVTQSGAGIVTLNQGSGTTGDLTVTAGKLIINAGAGWAIHNNLHISNGTLEISGWGGNAVQAGKTITFDASGGGVLNLASGNFYPAIWASQQSISSEGGGRNQITGGGINPNGNTLNFDIARGTDPVSDLKVICPFTNGGSLTKTGGGILEVSAASSLDGTTLISAGTLLLSEAGRLGSGAVTNNAALVFTLNSNLTVANSISGSGTLTQAGEGMIIRLTGTNSYGATTITSGTLMIGNNTTTGTLGNGAVTNDATLVFKRSNNLIVGNVISGSGSVTQSGAGVLTLSTANSYTGKTSVTAGTLRLGNGTTPTNLANSADVLVSPGAMLDLNYSGTDQIRSLWVDGSQLPPGVYSSSFPFITGTGTLTVTTGPALADYAGWSGRGGHYLSGGPAGDDDNDAIANVLEYVLGGNPRAASSGILPTTTASSGNLVFTFRRIHSTTADTTQVFQYGTTLSGWTDVPVVTGGMVAIEPDTPQAGTDSITITVPEGTEPRIFGRLKVSTLPAQP